MRRIEMDRLQELVRLHRMETGFRETARLLGMSPNTERQYRNALTEAGLFDGAVDDLPPLEVLKAAVLERLPPATTTQQQVSSLQCWDEAIRALFDKGLRPRALYDRLRLEHSDFGGSYWAMKRAWRRLKRERGVQPEDVAIPVETSPGEVAQVDFGYVGRLYDPDAGLLRKAWVFVMVLGYSRHMFARVVFDQKVSTWLRLHVEAFEALDGVIATVVPDNLKAAVVRAAFDPSEATALNRSYRELARYYGFKVDPAPPMAPKKKGKVESGVKYVKRNFFVGRDQADVNEVQRELVRWVAEIAGQRTHGTTGRRPFDLFESDERAALLPLPQKRFEPVVWLKARVHTDTHFAFDRRLYSVPWRLIGKHVWVRATATTVSAYFEDTLLVTHDRRGRGNRSTVESHLPDHRAPLRHRSRAYWEDRAEQLGAEVLGYVREVFDSDDVLSMLRTVQAIVTHLEKYPRERAVRACQRASFYGNYTYGGLKNILAKALDLQPLPLAAAPRSDAAQTQMRFARSIAELLHQSMEDTDEPN
jgi:transposase